MFAFASLKTVLLGTRSYRSAAILAIAARTCAADHTPPRGAEIPRSLNSFAIERSEFAPAVRMSSMTGARSAARDLAASDLACRALAQSAAVPARPRNPPSRLPRALAAVRAARVRSEIIFATGYPGKHLSAATRLPRAANQAPR
jgi:hypothetical protein